MITVDDTAGTVRTDSVANATPTTCNLPLEVFSWRRHVTCSRGAPHRCLLRMGAALFYCTAECHALVELAALSKPQAAQYICVRAGRPKRLHADAITRRQGGCARRLAADQAPPQLGWTPSRHLRCQCALQQVSYEPPREAWACACIIATAPFCRMHLLAKLNFPRPSRPAHQAVQGASRQCMHYVQQQQQQSHLRICRLRAAAPADAKIPSPVRM